MKNEFWAANQHSNPVFNVGKSLLYVHFRAFARLLNKYLNRIIPHPLIPRRCKFSPNFPYLKRELFTISPAYNILFGHLRRIPMRAFGKTQTLGKLGAHAFGCISKILKSPVNRKNSNRRGKVSRQHQIRVRCRWMCIVRSLRTSSHLSNEFKIILK